MGNIVPPLNMKRMSLPMPEAIRSGDLRLSMAMSGRMHPGKGDAFLPDRLLKVAGGKVTFDSQALAEWDAHVARLRAGSHDGLCRRTSPESLQIFNCRAMHEGEAVMVVGEAPSMDPAFATAFAAKGGILIGCGNAVSRVGRTDWTICLNRADTYSLDVPLHTTQFVVMRTEEATGKFWDVVQATFVERPAWRYGRVLEMTRDWTGDQAGWLASPYVTDFGTGEEAMAAISLAVSLGARHIVFNGVEPKPAGVVMLSEWLTKALNARSIRFYAALPTTVAVAVVPAQALVDGCAASANRVRPVTHQSLSPTVPQDRQQLLLLPLKDKEGYIARRKAVLRSLISGGKLYDARLQLQARFPEHFTPALFAEIEAEVNKETKCTSCRLNTLTAPLMVLWEKVWDARRADAVKAWQELFPTAQGFQRKANAAIVEVLAEHV